MGTMLLRILCHSEEEVKLVFRKTETQDGERKPLTIFALSERF